MNKKINTVSILVCRAFAYNYINRKTYHLVTMICGKIRMILSYFYIFILAFYLVSSVDQYGELKAVLETVIKAAEWKQMIVLEDYAYTELDNKTSSITSKYLFTDKLIFSLSLTSFSLDLTNRVRIVDIFEKQAKTEKLNWLILCRRNCLTILEEINNYEKHHQMQGYFTHLYQWIFIFGTYQNISKFQNKIGNITNVVLIYKNLLKKQWFQD